MEHLHKTYPNLAVILGMDDSPLGTYNVHTHRDYTDFYSDDAIRAVEEHEHLVIERFGYKFGEDLKKDMPAFHETTTETGETDTVADGTDISSTTTNPRSL